MRSTSLDVSRDAVVVVPGIMGSELVDTTTGKVLWGMADLRWYVSAWTSGHALASLKVTESELEGNVGRVKATRLLRTPAFAPVLRGIEPYRDLVKGITRSVAHPDAVLEFPYDWRLSVAQSAESLASAAEHHIDRWRRHELGSRYAGLVIVAHSMGGLVAQYFTDILGGCELVRSTITLGTPFYGAAKAFLLLSSGQPTPIPLPRDRLCELAITLPGVYDLLPTYRCVDDGINARRLTAADIDAIGGSIHLANQSLEMHSRLEGDNASQVHALVGVGQPTMQSIRIADGLVEACYYTCEQDERGAVIRIDRRGDSTVYRDSAAKPGINQAYLPQSHSALARSAEAIAHVKSIITRRPLGPPLGIEVDEIAVGVHVPDVVSVGHPFVVSIHSTDPAAVSCRLIDAATDEIETLPRLDFQEGALRGELIVSQPGIYRLEVENTSFSAVSQLLMAVAADDFRPEAH